MLENLDKIMHLRFNFDACPMHSPSGFVHLTHQNLSARALFCLNSLAKVNTQLLIYKYYTRPRVCSSFVSFWIILAHANEYEYHIFGQYWYTRNVPVFTKTRTFQYLQYLGPNHKPTFSTSMVWSWSNINLFLYKQFKYNCSMWKRV